MLWFMGSQSQTQLSDGTEQCLYHFTKSPAMNESSCCSSSAPAFSIVTLLVFGHSIRCISSYCSNLHFPSLVAQMVKRLPAMWETRVRSLGWEDPLEKGKTTHSNILV